MWIKYEEFTKEIPHKSEKVPPNDASQTDSPVEENCYIPSYNESTETAQNYQEQYEYIDGLWYPTACVLYNPAEVGLYSNYMMPIEPCYYYYTMPEVPQMQEYVPMPYQEYSPALPKDTVYLLLPTQTLRPSQPAQNLAPEWQSRRRRRQYEGYADYAAIPEKSGSTKSEERESGNASGQLVNSRRNSSQSNNFRKKSTETSKLDECNSVIEQTPACSKSKDLKKSLKMSKAMNNFKQEAMSVNKGQEYLGNGSFENNQKLKKNLEMCGIHSRNTTENKEPNPISPGFEKESSHPETEIFAAHNEKKISCQAIRDTSSSVNSNNPVNELLNTNGSFLSKNIQEEKLVEQSNNTDDKNEIPADNLTFLGADMETNNKTNIASCKSTENIAADNATHNLRGEDISQTSSLPDILSTLNKSSPNEKQESNSSRGSPLPNDMDFEKEIILKPKSLLTQTSYLPNLLSVEALNNEMEMELKQIQTLHSLKTNQSIYKLAYDESITDQSEVDSQSRSPSPIDPGSQMPSSITSSEIIIHEADTDSEAGSEDVELIPHRYESESFLNENKHVYINKLSLAVELLRTQESLPYDDEFKRVEINQPNILPGVHTGGKVNAGFKDDSCPSGIFSIKNQKSDQSELVTNSQYQLKYSANSSNDSAIFSDMDLENLEEELCETATEATSQNNETQDNTQQIRAGYRRIGVQARHFFFPRAASLNPCFCCILM